MARDNSKKSFLDFFKVKDLDDDEFDDDLFDDDDDDEEDYAPPVRKKSNNNSAFARSSQQSEREKQQERSSLGRQQAAASASQAQYRSQPSYGTQQKQQYRPSNSNGKLVDFNSQRPRESYRGKSEVYVIKPQEISESQTVTDFLKSGKTIVINMEGLELAPAQRIIDFIGGACYALNGSLQAISANIFIAAPESIEVSGDLREEILNSTTVSPQLSQY